MSEREVETKQLVKQMSVWFALKICPEKFDTELCRSILGKYYCKTRKEDMKPNDAMSDKQYSILLNIYEKYRVFKIFDWDKLPFLCVDMSELEMEMTSSSGMDCDEFFFQTKDATIYTTSEFVNEFSDFIKHPKYIKKLRPVNDDDF